jgi:hypothetical protein
MGMKKLPLFPDQVCSSTVTETLRALPGTAKGSFVRRLFSWFGYCMVASSKGSESAIFLKSSLS